MIFFAITLFFLKRKETKVGKSLLEQMEERLPLMPVSFGVELACQWVGLMMEE
jgi:hypothetical protein